MSQPADERLNELLAQWAEGRQRGHAPTAEELCRDCPELLPVLREQIAILQAMNWLEAPGEPSRVDSRSSALSLGLVAPAGEGRAEPRFPALAMSVEVLQRTLVDATLLTGEEMRSLLRRRRSAEPLTAATLARELVQQGMLTTFQLNLIAAKRTKELILGKYLLLDEIGAGGMGRVFKARHRRMDRVVAVKVLADRLVNTQRAVDRFHREMRAIARLSHPNIVTAYDADESGGRHFLVMQYVDGQDLATLVRAQGPLTPGQVINCVMQAAFGLEYAHQRGTVHRDIKPGNLLVDRQGTLKVLDLGLALMRSDEHEAGLSMTTELTGQGMVMGTVDYMAPEQALDTHAADARSDIYSLGCTLYFLLTGHPLYRGNTLMARMLAHREAAIPSLRQRKPETPACLDPLFARMVAKKPEDRLQSMTALIEALDGCAQELEPPPPRSAAEPPAPARPQIIPPAPLRPHSGHDETIIRLPRSNAGRSQRRLPLLWLVTLPALLGLVYLGTVLMRTEWTDRSADNQKPDAVNGKSPPSKVADEGLPVPRGAPAPLDALKPQLIPAKERLPWQPKELVGVIGHHAQCHWGKVEAVAYHPGGKLVASAGPDGIRLWDPDAPKEIGWIEDKCCGGALAFSPDGTLLVANTAAHGLKIWNVVGTNASVKYQAATHADQLFPIAFSPDGKRLAGAKATLDGPVIFLIDVSSTHPKVLGTFPLVSGYNFTGLGFLHDGKTLVTANEDKSVRFWDVATFKETGKMPGIDSKPAIGVSRDGKMLALSQPKTDDVTLWDVTGTEPKKAATLKGSGHYEQLVFSVDGTRIAGCMGTASSGDNWFSVASGQIWYVDRPDEIAVKLIYTGTAPALSPDGKAIAIGNKFIDCPGSMRFIDVSGAHAKEKGRGGLVFDPYYHSPPLAFTPDGSWLLTGFYPGSMMHVFELGAAEMPSPKEYLEQIISGAFSADGKLLLTSTAAGPISLWHKTAEGLERAHKLETGVFGGVGWIDAHTVAAGGAFHHLWLAEVKDNTLNKTYYGPTKGYRGVLTCGDGRTAVTWRIDEFPGVQVWDVSDHKQPKAREFPLTEPVGMPALSADGKRLFTFHTDGKVRLWDLSDTGLKRKIYFIEAWPEKEPGVCPAFAPNGQSIAYSKGDRKLVWRRISDGEVLREWTFPGRIENVIFSPDGRHLATGNPNGTIYLLRLANPDGTPYVP